MLISAKMVQDRIESTGETETANRLIELVRGRQLSNEVSASIEADWLFIFTDTDESWPNMPNFRVCVNVVTKKIEVDRLALTDARNTKPATLLKPVTGKALQERKRYITAKQKNNQTLNRQNDEKFND